MWTEAARRYFFAAGHSAKESDLRFQERYCSPRTVRNINEAGVPTAALRQALDRLSALVPDLEQSTPHWSVPSTFQPLVVFGRARLRLRPRAINTDDQRPQPVISRPRFGLCGIDGRIHLWTDRSQISSQAASDHGDWQPWSTNGTLCYHTHALASAASGAADAGALGDGQPLCEWVQDVGDQVGPPNFVFHEQLTFRRRAAGIPEEFAVAVPRLWTDGYLESPAPVQGHSDTAGQPRRRARAEAMAKEPLGDVIARQAAALGLAQQVTGENSLARSEAVEGHFYVYALIDPTRGDEPFYVGKGIFDRALQHFRAVRNQAPGTGQPAASEEPIVTEEGRQQRFGQASSEIIDAESRPGADLSDDVPAKIQRIEELRNQGIESDRIARVIARRLSENAAFAIEALLLKSALPKAALTNIAPGRHEERFRALGDWSYINGFDLPRTGGEVVADYRIHPLGAWYVYVLRDPTDGSVFYVGKGQGDRLCQHFDDARSLAADEVAVPRLERLQLLMRRGVEPSTIARVVARINDEALAYLIESFYMKFIIGFDRLLNVQPGHLWGMFRSRGDWKPRLGFDLPTEPGGLRRELLDMFLSDGLDVALNDIARAPELQSLIGAAGNPRMFGAGELAVSCPILGVTSDVQLHLHIRFARRVQISLVPTNRRGRQWIAERFGKFGLYSLCRGDDRFSPRCWRGASQVAIEPAEAIRRAMRLAKLALALCQAEHRSQLSEFDDLLGGLPVAPAPGGFGTAKRRRRQR